MAIATRCGACAKPLDPERHAVCGVCGGLKLCVECARAHYCSPECRKGDCQAGLCTRLVLSGLIAKDFGV